MPGYGGKGPRGDYGGMDGFGNPDSPEGPDNNKTKVNYSGLALTDEDGNLIMSGEDLNTPVGLTQTYFDNNPQNIQSAYDAGLMGTGLASTFSDQGLLNTNSLTSANTNINPNVLAESVNQFSYGEEERVKEFMDMGVPENVARIAAADMNISLSDIKEAIDNNLNPSDVLGAGYNALGLSNFDPTSFGMAQIGKGIFSLGEAMFGPTIEGLSDLTGIGNYKAKNYFTKNPQNFETGFTGPMTMDEDGNLVQDYEAGKVRYTGPMIAAIADEVAEIQGGYLSPEQQADLAIERYKALETEKNTRPGNPALTNPYIPVDPVRSKYEDEALEAYDRYIESGYTPEEAEYLIAYMGLA
tara:strand:+ start:5069 stop:6133 length:1065 start_codon:yes stop_codon:yes gene_type:complete